jgi:hypothetical protein
MESEGDDKDSRNIDSHQANHANVVADIRSTNRWFENHYRLIVWKLGKRQMSEIKSPTFLLLLRSSVV